MLAFFLICLSTSSIKVSLNEERGFLSWMRSTNQYYVGDEYHFRLGLYISTLRYIREFNKRKSTTFKVGLNKFSCYTPTEYKMLLGHLNPAHIDNPSKSILQLTDVPTSMDWRDSGIVNAVKDQGQCGSCWAFSAICTCESAYAINTGTLLSFSEQNLVDCDPSSFGCNGGTPSYALDYIIKDQNGQFNSEQDYPYKAAEGSCNFDQSKAVGKVTSYYSVFFHSETSLLYMLVQHGVVSVGIDASLESFRSYQSGVYQDDGCSAWFLDHAVACVGYGEENGVDYWIVRNSWGTAWGENGYVRILRGQNMCGIASSAFVAYV